MKIKPIDRDIKTVFETGFYIIPRFQRPYSWDKENLADFWNDVCASDDPDYFIGSMVLFKEKEHSDEFYVVDGQQRLTTIVILLCALRDNLHTLKEVALSTGIQRLIERPDIDNKNRYTLFSQTPYPFFQTHIQDFGKPELDADIGSEEANIKAAYDDFSLNITTELLWIDSQPNKTEKSKLNNKIAYLKIIRDKILRLQVIFVELDNEDDAYLIFETLNTRGKDLTPSDLVKNHLTRLLRAKNKNIDVTREKWNSIVRIIGETEAEIDVNNFLHHHWLSYREYVAEKKLFKGIKGYVKKNNAKEYLVVSQFEN